MQLVWIYGAPGVGKSTVGWQLCSDLSDAGMACAYVDIDQLGMCYPAQPRDPDRHQLKGHALAAVAPNYARSGATVLVVSGVLDPALTDWHRHVLRGVDTTFCRLTADTGELRRRLERRGATPEDCDRVRRHERELGAAQLGHPTVDTTGLTPQQVAYAVRGHLRSLARTTALGSGGPAPSATARAFSSIAPAPGRVIWVCGPPAVGKSTVAWGVFARLLGDGFVSAYLDLQQLGFLRGPDDAARPALQAANVAAMWGRFHTAGATHLVLSGAADTTEQIHLYRRELPGTELTVFRLRASDEELARRVQARGRGEGPRLAGDRLVGQPPEVLQEAVSGSREAQRRLEDDAVGDVVLDTTSVDLSQLADEILRRTR